MAQESKGEIIDHSSNMIRTNSLVVMNEPTSGGIFSGRFPVSCQSHTNPNKAMARNAVVIINRYVANFHHWLPLYSFHVKMPPTGNSKQ